LASAISWKGPKCEIYITPRQCGYMEPRSKKLTKTAKLLMAMSFSLIAASVVLLALFLTTVKPAVGGSAVLLFFSAAFSFLYHMQYVRLQCLAVKEALREYVEEMRQTGEA
jgi:membrane protein YdbS with pleckstrin-like domain